jgi:hypothetical protein
MKFITTLLLLSTFVTLTSCYRMPGDDEYSTLPTTNNPQVTKQRQDASLPAIGY